MAVHTIRLAGPWELQAEEEDSVRVQLPSDVPSKGRLVRKFHRPNGLSVDSKVRVELSSDSPRMLVRINDHQLSATSDSTLQFDMTSFLQPFNSLSVQTTETEPVVLQSAVLQICEVE